jgi:small-conductance mechanosensitive channel
MKFATAVVAFAIVLVLAAVIGVAAVFVPNAAVYVSIIAIGLSLALQKYVASFFAHFVIVLSGIYNLGDRIRIGNIKGDVRRVGLLHTTLEEVGEDEKLGGELTGRIIQVPNLIILDQPVLNYSKDYSVHEKTISSDYLFDEVRIPITHDSNVQYASELLENILKSEDEVYLIEARQMFQNGYPRFLDEAMNGPRVLVYVETKCTWISGKFVAPLRGRNNLRSRILLQFFNEIKCRSDVKLS